MSIKKKIECSLSDNEKDRRLFIENGAAVVSDKEDKNRYKNILVRLPLEMVEEIDAKVKEKPWMTRTQWVASALAKQLQEG